MGDKPRYVAGYAVIRIDDGPLDRPSRVSEFAIDGVGLPAPGPSNVTVKEVVTTADEAHREVIRLNALNAGKGCRYFWQSTHIFLNGGSHGSAGPTASEGQKHAEPATVFEVKPQSPVSDPTRGRRG